VIKDLKNRILSSGNSNNLLMDLLGKVTFQDRYKIRKLFLLNSNNRENNLSMVNIKNKNTIESIRLNHNKKVFFALIDCYQKKQNDLHLLLRNFLINLSIEQNKKFYYQSMVIFI
jgi:flagellar biosynthesis regulator FlaF